MGGTGNSLKNIAKKVFGYLRQKVYNFLAEKIDVFITFSNTSKKRLADHGIKPEKIEIFYQYIFETNQVSQRSQGYPEENNILYVGSFNPHKGSKIAIDSFRCLLKKRKDFHFNVIGTGSGEYAEQIRAITSDDGLKNHVSLLGHRNNAEVLDTD